MSLTKKNKKYLFFIILSLFFIPQVYAQKNSDFSYKVTPSSITNEPFLKSNGSSLKFTNSLQTNNGTEKNIDICIGSLSPNSHIIIETFYNNDTASNPQNFFIEVNLENINSDKQFLMFTLKDFSKNRQTLLGSFYSQNNVYTKQVINYNDYQTALMPLENGFIIYMFRNNDNPNLAQTKTIKFIDYNSDNKIDLIQITNYKTLTESEEISLFHGKEYFSYLFKKYPEFFEKTKHIFIDENEMGVVKFTGEKDKITIKPSNTKIIKDCFDFGDYMIKDKKTLNSFLISNQDRKFRRMLLIKIA